MILKRISYHNFRPFIGDQSVNLEPSVSHPERNVTVILGENTHGKSTFVLSFVWCLYGESRFNNPDSILNLKVENQMKEGDVEKASVEIKFEDGGLDYIVKRAQKFTMCSGRRLASDGSEVEIFCVENGESKIVAKTTAQIDDKINSILPKNLSEFFFFEGEKDNVIDRKDLGDSVRKLLGLEAYNNMRTHLFGSGSSGTPSPKSVMGHYLEQQSKLSSDKAQIEYKKYCAAVEELERINTRMTEIGTQIAEYQDDIRRLNESLRQAEPTKKLQEQRDKIKKEIDGLQIDLNRYNKRFLKLFGKDSFSVFLKPSLDQVMDKLIMFGDDDKGIKGIEVSAIKELLSRGKCLCGAELKQGNAAYNTISGYIDFLPPKSIGTLVRALEDEIATYGDKVSGFVEDFVESYRNITKCRTKIDEDEKEYRALLRQITDLGEADTSGIEYSLQSSDDAIKNLTSEKEDLIREQTRKMSEKETAYNNYNQYSINNNRARKFKVFYDYADQIYQWTNSKYMDEEAELMEKLNKYIKELFDEMYTGERDIFVDSKYNVQITYRGMNVAETGGLRVIKYFAYVGSLVKLAIEVKNNRDEGAIIAGGEYPLVLDAAFSHADSTHTGNISKALAGVASQLVFAVMKKDWDYAQFGISDKICRKYELVKIDDIESQIKEIKEV